MYCPKCNTILSTFDTECPYCGAVIEKETLRQQNVDTYWAAVHQSNSVRQNRIERVRQREEQEKKNQKKKSIKKSLRVIIPIFVLLVSCISFYAYRTYKNAAILQRVSNEVIGNSYSEIYTGERKRNSLNVFDPGRDYNKTIITFLDNEHLECVRTQTYLSLGSGWNDHDMYSDEIYSYSFRVTFLGKVWLQFNNHEYDADFKDDGSISKFWLYY